MIMIIIVINIMSIITIIIIVYYYDWAELDPGRAVKPVPTPRNV